MDAVRSKRRGSAAPIASMSPEPRRQSAGRQRLICYNCKHDVFGLGSLPPFRMRLKADDSLVKVVDGLEQPYTPAQADCAECGTTHYSDVWKYIEKGRRVDN